ncbi:MAG: DUF1732 domain-containing protein [Firmicutes bacterium]|nr:DUF1732 domain-containing protein [Bacillota bacterium]
MRSMTAYAEIIRSLERGQLRLTLRSVNHKGLELNVRMHPALFPLENALRAAVRENASRGKLDLMVEVQDEPSLEPQVNRPLLRSVAKAWKEEADWLELPPFTAEAFFRLPGAWLPPASDLAERLEGAVMEGLKDLLKTWNEGRAKEAQRLQPFFQEALERLRALSQAIRLESEQQMAEMPEQYRQRLEQILKDAQLQGQLPPERILAEAGVLAERQDVREEQVRLDAHLEDFAERLKTHALGGKALDVWCQEVLRELNTCGSKCKRLAMTRAVMEAKGVLDQIREQSANLE